MGITSGDLTAHESHLIYDALGRLVGRGDATRSWKQVNLGGLLSKFSELPVEARSVTRFAVDTAGRVLLARRTTALPGPFNTTDRFVYSAHGGHILLRDRTFTALPIGPARHYALFDPQGSVTALVDTSGGVVERFVYTPMLDRATLTKLRGLVASQFFGIFDVLDC